MKENHARILTVMAETINNANKYDDFNTYVDAIITRDRARTMCRRSKSFKEEYEQARKGLVCIESGLYPQTIGFLERMGCIERVNNDYGYDYHKLIKTTY